MWFHDITVAQTLKMGAKYLIVTERCIMPSSLVSRTEYAWRGGYIVQMLQLRRAFYVCGFQMFMSHVYLEPGNHVFQFTSSPTLQFFSQFSSLKCSFFILTINNLFLFVFFTECENHI